MPPPVIVPFPLPRVAMKTALWRGMRRRCPVCGEGRLLRGYLTPEPVCSHCRAPLLQFRADDMPPYVTVLIVGHLVVPGCLWLEQALHPPSWVQLAIWLPLTCLLTGVLLPVVKGALIGLHVALGLRGAPTEQPRDDAERLDNP